MNLVLIISLNLVDHFLFLLFLFFLVLLELLLLRHQLVLLELIGQLVDLLHEGDLLGVPLVHHASLLGHEVALELLLPDHLDLLLPLQLPLQQLFPLERLVLPRVPPLLLQHVVLQQRIELLLLPQDSSVILIVQIKSLDWLSKMH